MQGEDGTRRPSICGVGSADLGHVARSKDRSAADRHSSFVISARWSNARHLKLGKGMPCRSTLPWCRWPVEGHPAAAADQEPAQGNAAVGRKPVVQYVVEELARCGIGRLLFVTGPGKTAIENHFDIDAELIDSLRENGQGRTARRTGLRARGPRVFLHAAAAATRTGPRRALCPAGGREPVVRGRPGRFDHRAARPVGGGATMIERFESVRGRR